MKRDVWAVIPACNEGKAIGEVIKKAKRYVRNIIVVDDGSKDNTSDVAEKSRVIVLRHIVNLGKGAALKTGCDFALKKGAEILITLDADGQHDPKEIPRFLNELKNEDIVIGCRKLRKSMPLVLRYGNWFIHIVTRLLYGVNIGDTQSGYRAFTKRTYGKVRWVSSDYSMESEMIANIGKKGLRYKEIPIKTLYPDKYKGTTVVDGIKIVLNLVWWRLLR